MLNEFEDNEKERENTKNLFLGIAKIAIEKITLKLLTEARISHEVFTRFINEDESYCRFKDKTRTKDSQ